MGDWVAFWDSEHSIYVNARHRDVHYRSTAEDIARHVPHRSATVLDYGCGEALHAGLIAAAAGRLILCEAAPKVRAGLTQRFGAEPKIAVRAPEDLAGLPDASVDLIAVISVSQYLSPALLDDLLRLFRRLLKPEGRLLIADVIPPDVSPVADAMALLRFAAANGFLGGAVLGLVRTAFSDYRKLRSTLGVTTYTEADMMAKFAAAGLKAERQAVNIGRNPARMTFLAQPA